MGPALEYTTTDDTGTKATAQKLDTFKGVFMPTALNVLSILMFLRFSFIVGQAGFLGTMSLLIVSYALDLLTVMSISAISSNGTVRGGGAYYMISRTLGPEFGGSIGIVFYIGQVLNAGMNIVGFFEPLVDNFGKSAHAEHGHGWLPDSFWFVFLYGSVMCLICSIVCTGGSKFFSRVSIVIFMLLGISTLSIPFSGIVRSIFGLQAHAWQPSWETIRDNMFAHFTRGAAGSESTQRETWRSIFGLLFPATAGIFAGSADSGQLKAPSKSIPRGTLYGLSLTFCLYTSVIAVLAIGVPRAHLYKDLIILQRINLTKYLVILGALSTATFSTLCGINGAAKMLQAIARDDAFPFLSVFKYGTKATNEPLLAILITWLFTQLVLFADINMIASAVTMTFLLTFAGINLACFLLDVSSAPNFRPSFQYYSWHTALLGFVWSFLTMFYVDGSIASAAFAFLATLFLMVHYFGAPKNYGDVSQALIYHQVRKFLLRLDSKEHVKFWRPQILLLVNDARANLNLIKFCNALKKSGLYILGHVLITDDFTKDLPEMRKQQTAWARLVQLLKVKAFVQIGVSTDEVWGAMNMCLSSGLGGMKPNIVVMSFFNMDTYREDRAASQSIGMKNMPSETGTSATERTRLLRSDSEEIQKERDFLPTDVCRKNPPIGMQTYVNIVEDVIASFNLNIALTRGFSNLVFPEESDKQYIDLWPIQMSPATGADATGEILSTNFDTYTMILQMGQILHTVPKWNKAFQLRVMVFVEYKDDVEEERRRIQLLLDNLRIDAKLVVLTLDNGMFDGYEVCVKDCKEPRRLRPVEEALHSQSWWKD
ncbi:amino acid permease-domain-containing protein, partial [Protomyces lactucae-debilis]